MEILNYEKVEKGKVIGYVDVKVKLEKPVFIVLRRIAHLSHEDRRWFNFPCFSKDGIDSKTDFKRYYEFFEPMHNKKFMEMLSAELKQYERPTEFSAYGDF